MLIGYTDRLSVRPGEAIRFMVSTDANEYCADIVRLIHGDHHPNGPGFKEEIVTNFPRTSYPGRKQLLRPGSFVRVPDLPALRISGSMTLLAWVYPTLSKHGHQAILSKWSPKDNSGYSLFVGKNGGLSFRLGDERGNAVVVRMNEPLLCKRWQFVAATYNAEKREACLSRKLQKYDLTQGVQCAVTKNCRLGAVGQASVPFLIAASMDQSGVGNFFNGKISDPAVFDRALQVEEIEWLFEKGCPEIIDEGLVAAWDFSVSVSTDHVEDVSANQLHGSAINMPMRAVTGHRWTGQEQNFAHSPNEHSATHFHDDDLENAEWDVDFDFVIPTELKSGVYAARLRTNNCRLHLPFFVCPNRDQSSASIAFLIPTITYLAYSNEGSVTPGLSSFYSHHSDGSGVVYASRFVPLQNLNPSQGNLESIDGHLFARHLSADLYFIDWLEVHGYAYDVITDENLDHEGEKILSRYSVIATGSHPEYVTSNMLTGFEEYLRKGGRLIYFGGNGFYHVASRNRAKPHVIEIRRANGSRPWLSEPGENYHSSTGELGGLWRYRNRPPNRLVGVGFTAQGWTASNSCGLNRPYHRQPDSFDERVAFIFEGIAAGEIIADFESLGLGHGAAGDEIDRMDYSLGTPAQALLLATASGFSKEYQFVIEERGDINSSSTDPNHPNVRADMVYFECPNGGAVFSVSSISWFSCLSHNNYQNNVSKITNNVVKNFSNGGDLHP